MEAGASWAIGVMEISLAVILDLLKHLADAVHRPQGASHILLNLGNVRLLKFAALRIRPDALDVVPPGKEFLRRLGQRAFTFHQRHPRPPFAEASLGDEC